MSSAPMDGPIVDHKGACYSQKRCQLCHWRMEGWTRHVRLAPNATGDVTEEWCGAGSPWWDRQGDCPSRLGIGHVFLDDVTHANLFEYTSIWSEQDGRNVRCSVLRDEVIEWIEEHAPKTTADPDIQYGVCDLWFDTEAEAVLFTLRWL